jgi:rod shape-determining protein MreD
MRPWVFLSVAAGALVLQGAVVPHLAVGQVRPDLVLLVALAYGLLYGPEAGGRFGFVSGLLQDILLGKYVGVFALTRACAGYLAGLAERRFYKEQLLILVGVTALASVLTDLLFMGLMGAFGYPLRFTFSLRTVVLPAGLYNGLLSPLVYRGMTSLRDIERARHKATGA